MADSDFRPSDVLLIAPPLVGTMGSSEREHAAALLVRACQVLGDAWQPISFEQIRSVMTDDVSAKHDPFASLAVNPFFRPSFEKLCRDGSFVKLTGEPGALRMEFTALGLDALRRWVKPEPDRG